MPRKLKITKVEWEIMECVWNLGTKVSAREVHNRLYPENGKAYTTIQTIMNTLQKKGLLECEKIGMVNFYTPVKSRKSMMKAELSGIASQMFQGSVPALANFLIDTNYLGLDEIESIKELLKEKEKKLRSKQND